jgi:aldehyde dehydrogenase (NAD+)
VLKPAEASSYVATLLAKSAEDAELPSGVFNVVLGTGAELGPALIEAEQVRGVSFTGSAAVGAGVARSATARNIRYQTEMGGKNVGIVLADADIARAAALTAAGAMRYAGQKCTATSRVIVAREVEAPFMDAIRKQVEGFRIGPVTDPASAVGPVISERSRDNIRRVLQAAGGEQITPVPLPAGDDFAHGFFAAPTIIRGIAPDSPVAQEEIFGPVLAWLAANDLEHALTMANQTKYGLSASLFTRDVASALTYMRRIEVGLVRVNGDTTGVDPHAPFGGMRGSSSGSREQGPAARDFYTEIKTVQINP